ncbi:MAG: hypothetical protein ACYTGN_12610 [Planctomycetota bacterium]|jgi:hypothetical protein
MTDRATTPLVALALLATLAAHTVWAGPDTAPAPPHAAPKGSLFARRHASANFVLWTSIDNADLPALLDVAEKTRAETFRFMGVPARAWAEPLPLFLCRDAKDIKAAAEQTKVTLPSGPRSVGGYYRQGPLIAVVDSPARRALTVSHEVVHAVMRPLYRNCPSVLHEGIAMHVAERLVGDSKPLAAYMQRHRDRRARRLREARDAGQIPPLRNLLRFRHSRFHNKNGQLHYCVAWCLAETLADGDGKARIGRLLKACGGQDGWRALKKVYDEDDVEARWRALIDRLADAAK